MHDNEKADRLAKTAKKRTHKAVPRTDAEVQDRILEGFVNVIVFTCLQHTYTNVHVAHICIDSCVVTNKTKLINPI